MIIRPIQPATVTGQPKSVPGRGAAIADIWIKDRWNDWNLDVKQALFDMEKEKATDKAKRDFISKQMQALYDERAKMLELDAKDTMNWRDNMTSIERQRMQSTTQARIATMEERGRMARSKAELEARERIEGAKAGEKAAKAAKELKPAEAYVPAIKKALGESTQTGGQLNSLINYGAGPSGDVLLDETGVPLLQESYLQYQRTAMDSINQDPNAANFSAANKAIIARRIALENMEADLDPNVPKQTELFNKFKNTLNQTTLGVRPTPPAPRPESTGVDVRGVGVSAPDYELDKIEATYLTPEQRKDRLSAIDDRIKELRDQYDKIPELPARSLRERARQSYGTDILGKTPFEARQTELITRLQSMSPDQINAVLQNEKVQATLASMVQAPKEEAPQEEVPQEEVVETRVEEQEAPIGSDERTYAVGKRTEGFGQGEVGELPPTTEERVAGLTEKERASYDAALAATRAAPQRPAQRPAPQAAPQPAVQPAVQPLLLDFEDMPSSLPPIEPVDRQAAAAVPAAQATPAAAPRQQAPVNAQKTVAGDLYARFATEYDSPVQTAMRTVQQLAGQETAPRPGTQRKPEPVSPGVDAYKKAAAKPNPKVEDVKPILTDTTQERKTKDIQLLGLALGKANNIIQKEDPNKIKNYFTSREASEVLDLFNKYMERGDVTREELNKIYQDTVLSKSPGQADVYWNALVAYAILNEAKRVGWDMEKFKQLHFTK